MTLFEDGFSEPKATNPDEAIVEAIKDFATATDQLASLTVHEVTGIAKFSIHSVHHEFKFRMLLSSQYLSGYSFEVLTFGYDVTIYPASVIVESQIATEADIGKDFMYGHIAYCQDEEQLLDLLKKVFATDTFKKTVGGLMKLARQRADADR